LLPKIFGMKRILFLLLGMPFFVAGQDQQLTAEGTSPNLYVSYTVVAKDNFYSIGRLYNVSPKDIAPFNKMKLEGGLTPGQVLKIPLNKENFLQTNAKAAKGETLVPVYHTVKEKEGLYRIGINHNKVPVDNLKKWNSLSSDDLNMGQQLIVGYLKVKKNQSALASGQPAKKTDPVVVTKDPGNIDVVVEKKPEVKADEKVIAPPVEVKKEEPVKTQPIEEKKEEVVVKKEEVPVEPVAKQVVLKGTNFNGGVFKNLYESQTNGNSVEQQEGKAGVFKSLSGWKDGKYYCLHNTVAPGSVIKITNNTTGKSIYAKVLDVMPDIRQNNGLLLCVSGAAADELMAGEAVFNCTINYSK